jgi:glycosyltransferase involved in cell wall biosynthesis
VTDTIAVCVAAHPARATNGMLDEALRSIWAQTLLPDAVHVAMDTTRAGAPATRQRALSAASTDWVAFLDSDDLFLPQHLQHLLAHARETGADLVYSWFRLCQQLADGRRIDHGKHDPVFPPTHFSNPFNPAEPVETTITVLVRRGLAQQVGMRALDRGQINSGEDRAFTLDVLAAGGRIEHLVERTWIWRHHQLRDGTPGNASGLPGKGDAAEGAR